MASLEGLSDEQIRTLASYSKDLLDDPTKRREYQKLVKSKNPALVFPELEVDERVNQISAKVAEDTESLRAEIAKRDMQQRRAELQRSLSEKYPAITFEEIEATMVKHGVGDHEFAAKFLANERVLSEPAPEVPGKGGPMMMPSEAKQFFKNPNQVSRKLAHEVVTDLINRRNRARAGV